MKKLLVLGLLLAMSTGCGRGWHIFRGARCNGLCSTQAPAMQNNCENCGPAGYESYGAGDGYMGGDAIGSAPIGQTYETLPPMTTLPGALPGPIVNPSK
jgi:hypothetical protein